MIKLKERRTAKTTSHTNANTSSKNINDNDPNNKSKDGHVKVILSLFGLLIVVFIMFSVFQPKKHRPPDRPPLKVFYDKEKFINQHSGNPPQIQRPKIENKLPEKFEINIDTDNVYDDDDDNNDNEEIENAFNELNEIKEENEINEINPMNEINDNDDTNNKLDVIEKLK